jgi:hypothetical protein
VRFVCLTFLEVEGAVIRWDESLPKSQEMVAAAQAAGFSEAEANGSPVGVLEQDFVLDRETVCRVGARALIGTNGTTLIELP